ncbi:hypothetical protein CEXT_526541 [Caerostris extrusa]|uniref:Uncharacterized protein n=1 Tax=Caerostris extrusa TaxID=172846 RepID=A0AAV4Q1H6_CAEEX|nr:hypothetical protein CEXT_526541 [Caerostris extrusa]
MRSYCSNRKNSNPQPQTRQFHKKGRQNLQIDTPNQIIDCLPKRVRKGVFCSSNSTCLCVSLFRNEGTIYIESASFRQSPNIRALRRPCVHLSRSQHVIPPQC